MNILVCGGTRFMGKHLVNSLIPKKHDIAIATRGKTPDTFGDHVKRIIVNRLDYDSIKNAFIGKSYDVVYDTLAYCSNGVKILLDNVECGRYITISTTAVYKKHIDTREEEFNPYTYPMKWLNREDDIYDEVKRQAECAICQAYPHINSVMVRFPFVIGTDDFTERFKFYVEHILQNKAMNVDNLTAQMSFVRSDEAGRFLAYLAESEFTGVINGASEQTVSIQDVAAYVALKTGKKPIFSPYGDVAPYNGENEYSINVDRAKSLEFYFTPLNDWIFELIDYYIEKGEDST